MYGVIATHVKSAEVQANLDAVGLEPRHPVGRHQEAARARQLRHPAGRADTLGCFERVEQYRGAVKLKIKPRDAEVFVDGAYAGIVDEFDGALQSLKLNSGAYQIEVRKPGFDTLHYDVRVQPDHTVTLKDEMKAVK